MNIFIILLMINRLDVGISTSYITKIEKVADLPVGVMFLKPTIEYGSQWGGLMEDFYVSVDCNDTTRQEPIYIEMGANSLRVGPFYRMNIGELEATWSLGYMRIDVAALATGEFGGYKYAGQIDEERNGQFIGLKLKYRISDIIWLNPFSCFGKIKKGSFWEYGGVLGFMPFKRREVPNILRGLVFTVGISIAHLGYAVQRSKPYSLNFGYYLVGVSYELELPKKLKAEGQKLRKEGKSKDEKSGVEEGG